MAVKEPYIADVNLYIKKKKKSPSRQVHFPRAEGTCVAWQKWILLKEAVFDVFYFRTVKKNIEVIMPPYTEIS